MNDDALAGLLERLNAGDNEAAEQFFLAYKPYLQIVVHRRLSTALRTKFDSMDVVQSVWADVLDGLRDGKWSFDNVNQLRSFLVNMARNRFIDRFRHHRTSLDREVTMPDPGVDALPALACRV